MPSTTEATLKAMIPNEYHKFLDVFNPSGPTKQLPPSHPGYDFEIRLDPAKPLPPPAQPYWWNQDETADWKTWRDTAVATGWIEKAPANCPTAAPFFFVWKKDGT
jgi:hypothetical protein